MDLKLLSIIIGMAIVTYLPRMLPLVGLSKIPLPKVILRWLSFIPVAVLSALLLPSIVLNEGQLNVSTSNPFLLASLPALIIAFWKKSLLLTVIMGMIALIIVNKFA